jgi:hypothetical protein
MYNHHAHLFYVQMGFTDNAYPSLPAMIKERMPRDGTLTKDAEDDIVTTVLEDLLTISPTAPVASSSGPRAERDVPGAWE